MTTFESYSQHGEDCILWQFFGQKQDGFYIEVGAFDGRYLSNSYAFEREGWSGLCIEPVPQYFEMCQRNRPNATCIHAACVADKQQTSITFYEEPLGLVSGVDVELETVKEAYRNRNVPFAGLQEIQVPAYTLNALLEQHLPSNTPIDFISIDVEGTETAVLDGFDLERYAPRVVILEANTMQTLNKLIQYMARFGYYVGCCRDVNYLFVKDAADIQQLATLERNCPRAQMEHPLQANMQATASPAKKGGLLPRIKRATRILLGMD